MLHALGNAETYDGTHDPGGGRLMLASSVIGADWGSIDGNPPIDFSRAHTAGLRWCYRRLAWGTWIDPEWKQNRDKVLAAGLVDGGYLFLRADDERKSPEQQVDAALAAIASVGGLTARDLPVALDLEFPIGDSGEVNRFSRAEGLDWIVRAWRKLRDAIGYPPMIYTSARWLYEDLGDLGTTDPAAHGLLALSDLWITKPWPWRTCAPAQYGSDVGTLDPLLCWRDAKPTPWGQRWSAYQYQGDAAGFPGFKQCDLSRWNVVGPGSSGEMVSSYQRRLGVSGTGVFDDETTAATQELQRQHDLVADGWIGPATYAPLSGLDGGRAYA